MKKLKDIFFIIEGIETPKLLEDIVVESVTNDSRQIVDGCLFLAEQGLSSHGLDYLSVEQCQRLAAVVYQPEYDISRFETAGLSHKFIPVPSLNERISQIGKQYFQPRFSKSLIGVTGTNGKTSITHFIAQFADYGVIGTMGYGSAEKLNTLSHTTPDALSVQRLLGELSLGFSGVAMEVSSHALSLHRVAAVDYRIAIFTNLSQDHLDFHNNMAEYFAAKRRLFTMSSVAVAVINTDDESGYQLAKSCVIEGLRVLAYGEKNHTKEFAEYVLLKNIELSQNGLSVDLHINLGDYQGDKKLSTPIWGGFNAANLMAAILALYADGINIEYLLSKSKDIKGVLGRIEPIDLGKQRTAIIDYAHTPDALESTLKSLRQQIDGKIYVVFGCGGDRDKTKRPLMAEAVNQFADIGIITDDNPRTEKSADIISDMLVGNVEMSRFYTISSRRDAINYGLSQLAANDVLLIAGKGHEDYQIIGTEKTAFSDHEVVKDWLNEDV